MNEFTSKYYKALENMNGKIIEYIRGNKDSKIFGKEDIAFGKYEESINHYKTSTLKLYNRMWFATSPSFVIFSSLLVSVLCIGDVLYCNGEIIEIQNNEITLNNVCFAYEKIQVLKNISITLKKTQKQ